jgi:hypothetical protein
MITKPHVDTPYMKNGRGVSASPVCSGAPVSCGGREMFERLVPD